MVARRVLYTALLSCFVLSSGLEAPVESEAKQCLMQRQHQISRNRPARNLHEVLPEPILALAWRLFEKETRIIDLVENSELVNITYAGVDMSLRMNKADDATRRLGEEGKWSSYDLDTLGDQRGEGSKGALNMLDLGGSYGVVSIAAFKKYAKRLRVVTVEPIPTTFFFLKWNLYINGVPEIEKIALEHKSAAPGVLALNRGTDDVDGKDLHFCFDPKSSMNSRVCKCKRGDAQCLIVPSVTVDSLAGMFGKEAIAMVKMDCEGCEFKTLPALADSKVAQRVRRLAGELHLPDRKLEELACRWDKGRLMSKCQQSSNDDIECGVELTCPE